MASTTGMSGRQTPSQDRVVVVQPRVVDEVDEELRVAGVAAARRSPTVPAGWQAPISSRMNSRWPAVLVRAGASALDDEVRHDAMEGEPVVVVVVGASFKKCSTVTGGSARPHPHAERTADFRARPARIAAAWRPFLTRRERPRAPAATACRSTVDQMPPPSRHPRVEIVEQRL